MTARTPSPLAGGRRRLLAASLLVGLPAASLADPVFIPSAVAPAPLGGAAVTGQVTGMTAETFQLALRGGRTMVVRLHAAKAKHLLPPAVWVGEYVRVQGKMTGTGTMAAFAVGRAKSEPRLWLADVP